MQRDPRRLDAPRPEKALAGLAGLIAEVPWALEPADVERAREAGLSEATVLHAILVAAIFNYFNRVADGVGLNAIDTVGAMTPVQKDEGREAILRPERRDWPSAARTALSLRARPLTAFVLSKWRGYMIAREAQLGQRARDLVRASVARALCDGRSLEETGEVEPRSQEEGLVVRYAEKLTLTPWRISQEDLSALRAAGMDDRALLDLITLVAFQNFDSRLRLVLAV